MVKNGMPDSVNPYLATIQLLIKFIDNNTSEFSCTGVKKNLIHERLM